MTSNNNLLGDFVNELYAEEHFEQRFRIYEKYIKLLNFEGAAYTCLPKLHLDTTILPTPSIFIHSNPYPTDFLEHYVAENLYEHDFSLKKVKKNDFSISDYRETECQGTLDHKEVQFITLAREDYGLVNTLAIPGECPTAIAGINIFSSEKDNAFSKLKQENINTLRQCTQIFHSMTFSSFGAPNMFLSPFLKMLKPKEIIILHYVASGKPFKNIEYSTGISYRYASNIMNELRARLGGITRDRLLYLTGLLNIPEYKERNIM